MIEKAEMIIQAIVDENGVLKLNDPNLWGKEIYILSISQDQSEFERETDWEAIGKLFEETDKLDLPRRTHDEIIRDLHRVTIIQ